MPAGFEELIAFIAAQLPQPVQQDFEDDGSVLFVGGDPAEVVVELTSSTVTVAEYAVSREASAQPAAQPIEVGSINWHSISDEAALRLIRALISAAREAREAKFRTCVECSQTVPPEWMHDDELCRSCAANPGGLVH